MERIKGFFAPPVFEEVEKTRSAYILNVITLVFIVVLIFAVVASVVLLGSFDVFLTPGSRRTYVVIGFMLLVQFLMRRGNVHFASTLLILFLLTFITVISFVAGGVLAIIYMPSLIVVVLAGLLLNNRAMALTMAYIIALGFVQMFLGGRGLLPLSDPITPSLRWVNIVISVVMIGTALYLFIRKIQESEKATEIANAELQKVHTELEVQVSQKTRGLEIAATVGQELAQERDLDQLLKKAVNTVREQFDLYYVQIYLADVAGRRLVLRAGTGEVGDTLAQRGHRLAVGAGSINGAAASAQQPIVVSDTAVNPLFRPNALLPETKAEMAVPLVVADHLVGVLNVQSNEAYGLTTDDFTTYNVLAGQVAIAVENANLFSATRKAQLESERATQQSTRQNWEAYLDALERRERFGYTFDGLALDDVKIVPKEETVPHEQATVVPIIVNGELIGSIEIEGDELEDASKEMLNAVAQQVAQQAENLRLLSETEKYRDEAEDAVRRLTRENWEAYEAQLDTYGYEYDHNIVHPLEQVIAEDGDDVVLSKDIEIHGETIGQLEICEGDADSIEAEALLSSVTVALSAHIENLRLTEQTETALADAQQRGERLDLINRVVTIATESLDIEYTLQATTDELAREMSFDRVSISLIDQVKQNFTIAAEFNLSEEYNPTKGMTFSLKDVDIMSEVVQNKTIIIDELQTYESDSVAVGLMREMGFHLFAILPMRVGQDVVGTVSVASITEGRKLSEDELVLLRTMIRQMGTAVQNARLFAETQQRARRDQILNEITASVHAAVDAESILRTAAKEINRTLGVEAFVYLEGGQETAVSKTNGVQKSNEENGHHT